MGMSRPGRPASAILARRECSRSRGLSVRYGKHLALDGVSLSVGPGEIVVMLGANGAGKSSCLKALGGMVAHLPGARIALGSVDLTDTAARTSIVEAGLALVPEDRGIFADLSVRENLQLGAYHAARAAARGRQPARRSLTLFPRLGRAHGPARAHHERRRAADAGDRPGADVAAPTCCCSTSPRSACRRWCARSCSRRSAASRTWAWACCWSSRTRAQSLAIGGRGYLLENGRIVGEGAAGDLQGRPGRAPRLSRRRRWTPGGARRRPLSNGRIAGADAAPRPALPERSADRPPSPGCRSAQLAQRSARAPIASQPPTNKPSPGANPCSTSTC